MKCNHCGSEWNVSPGLSISTTNCPFCGKSILPPKKQLTTVEDTLVEINRLFGINVLTDETKLVAFFSDLAPQLSRQRRILSYFVECGGPKKIVSVLNSSEVEQSVCFKQIVREMKENMYIEEAASQMICEAFLFAVSGRRSLEVVSAPIDMTIGGQHQKGVEYPNSAKSDKVNAPKQGSVVIPSVYTDKQKEPQVEKQDNSHREQLRKDILRTCMTGEGKEDRIKVLAIRHRMTRYLVCGTSNFQEKVIKAIWAYASPALRETPLLMQDSTIFGTAKKGFVLTDKTLYWDGGIFVGSGQCLVEDITAVSIHTSSDGKLFYIKLTSRQSSSGDKAIEISYTSDEKEAAQIESFWKEVLLLI